MRHEAIHGLRLPRLPVLIALSLMAATNVSHAADQSLAQRLAKVKFERYAAGPGYSEGPTWRDGEVFFCSGALLRVDTERKVHKYLEINPAGTVLLGNGHLLICDNKHKALLKLDPNGKVGVVADQAERRPLNSLNDLTVDARGNVYWTDPSGSSLKKPIGNIFRVRPDGRVDRLATGLAFPNGIEVDPASEHLYVIESQSKRILRYKLPADNDQLGPPEVFYDLGGSGGDGCAFDADGNLWVADFHRPQEGTGRITVLSPNAKVLAYLPLPSKVVSNITFGGKNRDEIFCTTGTPPGVFHAKVGVKGFAGHPGKPLRIERHLNVVTLRPHPDADMLRNIAQVAAEAKLKGGKFSLDTRKTLQSLSAALKDSSVRADTKELIPSFERAAKQYARDRLLLAEIKRLRGKVVIEIAAPNWLRSIVGDEGLPVFGRLVEVFLNENTDGHKKVEPKAKKDRVTNKWLKNLAGQDRLRRLELSGTAVASDGLVHLKHLKNMERLNLCLTAVDDRVFEHLAGMTKMRRMVICASKITGTGFKHLQGMKQIESINLHSSVASDDGLAAIGKLTSLRRLEIVHTHVTDAGLKHLGRLVNLQRLHIHGPETTENGLPFLGQLKNLFELDVYDHPASNATLAEISRLPNLRYLRLFIGTFDDEGVKHLAGLKTLEKLTLNSRKVTDAAVEHLAKLENLRVVNLGGTRVTEAGKQRLQKLLPKAELLP